MSAAQANGPDGPSAAETGDKIDRIRDILLGGSLDEVNRRLGAQEARLQAIESTLRDEMERRFASLDDSVSSRLEERAAAERELRQIIADGIDVLHRETAQMQSAFEASVKQTLAGLDTDKVDRTALARMLTEVVVQLQGGSAEADSRSASNG